MTGEICRAASVECRETPNIASRIASAATVAAVERLARADRRHAATVEQWDSDPWLLNTPGGTVDLRTGRVRLHWCEDYCTKITGTAPGGDCALWLRFLERVPDGDVELQVFLARMVKNFSSSPSARWQPDYLSALWTISGGICEPS